ncbi:MAG: hypothetical protein AB7O62_02940 [Pirellulales bacterium]
MARRKGSGPNKSELVRQYVATHKRAKNKQVQEALMAEGHDVSIQLISNVRNSPKRKKKGSKAAVAATNGHASSLSEVMALLLTARKLVQQAGSTANARKAVDAVAKL